VRDGQSGFDASQLSVKDSTMDPMLNQVRSRLVAYSPGNGPGLRTDAGPLSDTIDPVIGSVSPRDDKDDKSDVVDATPDKRWSSFIAGDVILANLTNDPNVQDADYTTGTITAGVDYRLDDHFTVGALISYAHSAVDLDSRGSSATVDSYSPGFYASYVDGPWYANGMASYGRNTYTEDRVIDIPGITGDNHGGTSGNQGTLNLTGGREFRKGAFKFGPVASLDYVHLNIGSINEQGPTALNISTENQDSLRTLLGVEGRYTASVSTPLGIVVLTPHLTLNWQHEYLDSSDGITSQFNGIGGGAFTVQTDTPQRDSAFLEAGIDMVVSENVVLFLDYAAQAGQDNFFAQSAQGGAKIGF
jgi:outer membrane autotransporter protein